MITGSHGSQLLLCINKVMRLLREVCLCLAVIALLLIGSATVLLATKTVQSFEMISRILALGRQQFRQIDHC